MYRGACLYQELQLSRSADVSTIETFQSSKLFQPGCHTSTFLPWLSERSESPDKSHCRYSAASSFVFVHSISFCSFFESSTVYNASIDTASPQCGQSTKAQRDSSAPLPFNPSYPTDQAMPLPTRTQTAFSLAAPQCGQPRRHEHLFQILP